MAEKNPVTSAGARLKNNTGVIMSVGGSTGLALAQAPLWAMVVCIIAGLLCALVNSVFPQDSADRLAWWKALWKHRRGGGDTDET